MRAALEVRIVAQAQRDPCFYAYHAERTLEEFQHVLQRLVACATRLSESL
jgi:hypothetical protein